MKVKFCIVLFFILGILTIKAQIFKPLINSVIGANDSVIFDLSNAILTPSYIDIPVYIKSNNVIGAIDFSLKFDELKLTYDSVSNYTTYLLPLTNFNLSDRFLRFTCSSLQAINQNTTLIAIRFYTASPCLQINNTDFNSITTYLNGDVCSYGFTNAPQYALVANFNHNALCVGNNVTFNDTSSFSGASIISWNWNFGNSITSTLQNPTISYTNTGNFNVTLIVTSNIGCNDTIVQPVTVNPLPISNFSYLFNCLKDSVYFTNSSTGSIIGWSWYFGDGNTGISQNPIHNYNSGGTFVVSLTSTNDSGCTHTVVDTILLNKPTANFGALGGCVGSSVNFSDSSTFATGTIIGWNWYFGDGNASTLQIPSHIYNNAGTYTVGLVVSSSVFAPIVLRKQLQ